MDGSGALDFELRARSVLRTLSPDQRRTLLECLNASQEQRARLIGQIFGLSGHGVADLLIDAEAIPAVRLTLVEQLLQLVREDAP